MNEEKLKRGNEIQKIIKETQEQLQEIEVQAKLLNREGRNREIYIVTTGWYPEAPGRSSVEKIERHCRLPIDKVQMSISAFFIMAKDQLTTQMEQLKKEFESL